MSSETGDVAQARAGVDNQKNAETCSLFAISKAVCNGFETDKFFPGYLDFDQGETKTALLGQIYDAVSIRIIRVGTSSNFGFNASSSNYLWYLYCSMILD